MTCEQRTQDVEYAFYIVSNVFVSHVQLVD